MSIFFGSLVAARSNGIYSHNRLFDAVGNVQSDQSAQSFSAKSRSNKFSVMCDIHIAIQLIALESFQCKHEDVYFNVY